MDLPLFEFIALVFIETYQSCIIAKCTYNNGLKIHELKKTNIEKRKFLFFKLSLKY